MIPKVLSPSPELTELVEGIQCHPDFVLFVRALLKDLKEKPAGWENRDLPSFLEALAAWTEGMDGYYQGKGGEPLTAQPSWKTMAEILLAAKVYE